MQRLGTASLETAHQSWRIQVLLCDTVSDRDNFIFIYVLFKDAVSRSDYMALNN